jgi:hypothetical protein
MDIRPDTVIFATGYTQCFNYLDKESNYPSPRDADLRNIARSGDEDLAFIGYVRPGVGKADQSLIYILKSLNISHSFRCNTSAC